MKTITKRYCLKRQFVLLLIGIMLYVPAFSEEIVDRIVAVVNNDIITLVELNTAVQPFLQRIETQNYPEEKAGPVIYQLKQDMLNRMIDRKLIDQEAARYNITVTDQEVDAGIERFKQVQSLTQEALETALKMDGIDFGEYREVIRKELLRPKLINHVVKSRIIITSEDVKAYYEANIDEFRGVRRYHLRNIVHDNEALMKELKIRLDHNESFAELAIKYSQGKNASRGGDLGEFKLDLLSETIKESLTDLNTGDHTVVISTDQGFQLFYVENITVGEGETLEAASGQIMEALYNQETDKRLTVWLETLKEKAHIKMML